MTLNFADNHSVIVVIILADHKGDVLISDDKILLMRYLYNFFFFNTHDRLLKITYCSIQVRPTYNCNIKTTK
jgi:hypothetical protein